MAAWLPFGALAALLIAVLFLLSVVSARTVDETGTAPERTTALERSERLGRRHGSRASTDPRLPRFEPSSEARIRSPPDRPSDARESAERTPEMSTGALLANVALTQGVFGVAVLAAAAYFAIPFAAFGVESPLVSPGTVAIGIGLGVVLWLANETIAGVADAAGVGYDEAVRTMLTPETTVGWVVLLGIILPIIAVVEELLFRGMAIGAFAAGFGVHEVVLLVVSSLVFGGAHGAQGRIGAAVATGLGLLLGAAFVLTGSLLVVVVAHYLVNALEFVVHEGLAVDRPLATVPESLRGG